MFTRVTETFSTWVALRQNAKRTFFLQHLVFRRREVCRCFGFNRTRLLLLRLVRTWKQEQQLLATKFRRLARFLETDQGFKFNSSDHQLTSFWMASSGHDFTATSRPTPYRAAFLVMDVLVLVYKPSSMTFIEQNLPFLELSFSHLELCVDVEPLFGPHVDHAGQCSGLESSMAQQKRP